MKKNDKIQEAIAVCKFYKGEKKNPYDSPKLKNKSGEYKNPDDQTKALLWEYEEKFCFFANENEEYLNNCLAEYKMYKGARFDVLSDKLVALLFNRYFHWAYSSPSDKKAMNEFYDFIKKYYL